MYKSRCRFKRFPFNGPARLYTYIFLYNIYTPRLSFLFLQATSESEKQIIHTHTHVISYVISYVLCRFINACAPYDVRERRRRDTGMARPASRTDGRTSGARQKRASGEFAIYYALVIFSSTLAPQTAAAENIGLIFFLPPRPGSITTSNGRRARFSRTPVRPS